MSGASILALALAAGGPATEARDVVLVLPVEAGPSISPELQRDLQTTLEDGFARSRLQPVRDPEADACADDRCIKQRASAVNASFVLRSSIVEEDRNFTVALALLDPETLEAVARSSRECEVCGSAEVLEQVSDEAAALAARPAVERPVLGTIVLRSRPSPADVAIDGEASGHTPLRRDVPPGPHRVTFTLRGHADVTREVTITAGVEEVVDVELERRRQPMRIAGGVLLGLGLAATGVGAGLLVIDRRPYRRQCDGDDVDFAGRCRFRLDTTAGGAAAAAVGLAAVAVGIGLLVASRR